MTTPASQSMRKRVAAYITALQETISKPMAQDKGSDARRGPGTRGEVVFPVPSRPSTLYHPSTSRSPHRKSWRQHLDDNRDPPARRRPAHAALEGINKSLPFFAAGLSLIIHPRHPRVPGVHANYRYFEVLDTPLPSGDTTSSKSNDNPSPRPTVLAWWFGVITDLSPAYVNEPDFRHFHNTLKTACDTWSDTAHTVISVYPVFNASCDSYLYTSHRQEHRGIGGVRFDDMDSDAMHALLTQIAGGPSLSKDTIVRLSSQEALFDLVRALGDSFLPSFTTVMERWMGAPIVPSERRWQLLRRGRGVEFNLVVDRGTRFGLAAPGVRAENVLVGMPPEAQWEYCCELGLETKTRKKRKW